MSENVNTVKEEIAVTGNKTECEFRFNPTNTEFWDALNRSKYKLLRGMIANDILFIWDASQYTHDQAFYTLQNSEGLLS